MSGNPSGSSIPPAEPGPVVPTVDQAAEGNLSEPTKPDFRVYRPPQSASHNLRTLCSLLIDAQNI